MNIESMQGEWTSTAILKVFGELLSDMIEDWDTEFEGPLGPETRLVEDLLFESIDIVQLIVAIEERFRCKGLPFEELVMADGRYVDEIKVGDAVAFLQKHLNNRGAHLELKQRAHSSQLAAG